MNPIENFEHQLLLSSFSLASHSLRLLAKAGLLDDDARTIIRTHLQFLQEMIDAVGDEQTKDTLLIYLDALTAILPPPDSGGNSQAAGKG